MDSSFLWCQLLCHLERLGVSLRGDKSPACKMISHTHTPLPELGMSLGKLHTILRAHSWPFFSVIYKRHYRHKPGSAILSWRNIGFPPAHSPLHLAHTFLFCVRLPHMHVFPGKDPKLPQLTLTEGHASRSLSNFPKHHRICKKCVLL